MLIDVHFQWDDDQGLCEDCGLPAAFRAVGPPQRPLCSVCAANAAAEGERIERLEEVT